MARDTASKALMSVTPVAVNRIKALLQNRGKPSAGIRIGLKTKGCNGLSYSLEFADAWQAGDEKIDVSDLTIFVDPKAVLFIVGTQMDYRESALESGFVFNNPNEKGRCGCGESFHV